MGFPPHAVVPAPAAVGRGRCDVLLLVLPGGLTEHFAEHVGVPYLRAVLLGAGVRAEQFLPERNVSAEGLAVALKALRPAIVGLTIYETNLCACRAATQVVRRTLPEAVIMAGGPSATFSPAETLELVGADACLRGAGEARFRRVVEAVLGACEARSHLPELLAEIPGSRSAWCEPWTTQPSGAAASTGRSRTSSTFRTRSPGLK